MASQNSGSGLTRVLLDWYQANKRDLPWRRTPDPYRIWLSEVIMQQTRIEQGLPYYELFAGRFPTVNDLAAASPEEVLKCWQGLGYYSRARHLHETAMAVAARPGSLFPDTFEGLLALKGIGEYTAAAIASISHGLPHPVVDGNVIRFLARFHGIHEPTGSSALKRKVGMHASLYLDHEDPGSFNQAMMEFGALQCRPVNPDCNCCPFISGCYAYARGMVSSLPVKGKKTRVRTRHLHYLVMHDPAGSRLLMKRRDAGDIWNGLYDFPLIETSQPVTLKALTALPEWPLVTGNHNGAGIRRSPVFRHLLTHQIILARFYQMEATPAILPSDGWVPYGDMEKIPVPKLIERYLKTGKEAG
jgi:A/G-specific adenine glycosylase